MRQLTVAKRRCGSRPTNLRRSLPCQLFSKANKFTSLQYTSMNTLVYADIPDDKASNASSIASTMQQMSVSFGVAVAGLTTAVFIPASSSSSSGEMIHGLHEAFLVLGGFTVLSTVIFGKLKNGDGENETRQRDLHLG